ncbi:hypothetical protein DXG01_008426 [Tephrocybe rancida]|nr:hypothetical protein DXG01_008426 [Tephrocybe rancida]
MFKSTLPAAKRLVSVCPFGARSESTALHFYQNRQLELYASKEAKRLTLRQLSANYVRTELPVRIAHRLRDLQALPYIVVTQEGVAKTYELYWSAFEQFRRYPPITTLEENGEFCRFLTGILAEHATVIPSLSLGLSLSSRFLPPDQLDSFMRRMLVSRISRRVLAEHHIALSEIHAGTHAESSGEPHVGIIFTGLDVRKSVERCVRLLKARPVGVEDHYGDGVSGTGWPDVIIDGHLDTKFAYIKEHLEYIMFELLKNSMRATAVRHRDSVGLPAIRATIVAGDNEVGIRISDEGGGLFTPQNQIKTPSDLFSFSHIRNATRLEDSRLGALRTVSSSAQGIRATVGEQVGRWQNDVITDVEDQVYNTTNNPEREAGVGPHPRIGIGLPMSNIFATYFGGSLELVSLDGWEQELDQKISEALVISQAIQKPQTIQQGPSDDDEWEQWDESVFAAAVASNNGRAIDPRLNAGSSGASLYTQPSLPPLLVPAVEPLRIHKRGIKSISSTSWTGEGGDRDESFGSPGSSSSGHAIWKAPHERHEIAPDSDDEDNDRSIPPPPFASVGPRMDGIVRLEYHPESTPPSPLNSPVSEHHPPLHLDPSSSSLRQTQRPLNPGLNPARFPPQPLPPQRAPRQSLPVPPRSPNFHLEQRPVSTFHPRQDLAPPQTIRTQPILPSHTPDRVKQRTVSTLPPQAFLSHATSASANGKTEQTLPPSSETQSFTVGALYKFVISPGRRIT